MDAGPVGWWRVTDPATTHGPARASWLPLNIVLIVIALVLVVASVLWFTDRASATPADRRAASLSREYEQVTKPPPTRPWPSSPSTTGTWIG